jgi:hypothetical protein
MTESDAGANGRKSIFITGAASGASWDPAPAHDRGGRAVFRQRSGPFGPDATAPFCLFSSLL